MKENKNVLFLVTGMTPAIITETIWALACDPELAEDERWIPDEVQVLSTQHGINQIKARMFESGVFEQFKKDYPQIAHIQFDKTHLISITDKDGKALSDLRTPEDNEFAADKIHDTIAQLTQNDHITLHVSIAGGRKTMGFYAGYALSIFGRAQDSMSHVLVDECFETIPDFFYPTPHEYFVKDRNGQSWDAHNAQVWLAEIPFVRMKDAIKKHHQIHSDSFSNTVRKINEANKAIKLVIDVKNKSITINDSITESGIPPLEFALLCLFAQDRIEDNAGIRARAPDYRTKPLENTTEAKEAYNEQVAITQRFISFYKRLRDEFYLEERIEDYCLHKSYMDSLKSKLKSELEKRLGLELATKLEIKQDARGKPFYLSLDPSDISFI
ncbi:CRISPR-associated ring nuclease Csm6 [Oligella urethralis]|uniref:CRISPR-associated ring nuclease Csm6 n=1 Tax=Oligella urethralis TaxID=90245 RepID=UPI000DFEABCF|nr:CRISPR-associated ring nuclease Csm6 [Oligella urethralis]SUA57400.1 CRISPR-associated protein, NE0113 family [Oligella urethralis]